MSSLVKFFVAVMAMWVACAARAEQLSDAEWEKVSFYKTLEVRGGTSKNAGGQMVNTGYIPTGNEIIRARFKIAEFYDSANQTLFCSRGGSNSQMFYFFAKSKMTLRYISSTNYEKSYTWATSTLYDFVMEKGHVVVSTVAEDDTLTTVAEFGLAADNTTSFGSTTLPLALFSSYDGLNGTRLNGSNGNGACMDFKYLKILHRGNENEEVLDHEYLPCQYNSKSGLADTQTKEVFFNYNTASSTITATLTAVDPDVVPEQPDPGTDPEEPDPGTDPEEPDPSEGHEPDYNRVAESLRFRYKMPIELKASAKQTLGEAGELVNFPLPVRLSDSDETGFSHRDFRHEGQDVRFVDAEGHVLWHELDTYNPEGESLYWVKVPVLTKDTVLTCYYGADTVPQNDTKKVWSDYVAVAHGGAEVRNAAREDIAVSTPGNQTQACKLYLTSSAKQDLFLGGGFQTNPEILKSAAQGWGVVVENPVLKGVLSADYQLTVTGWFKREALRAEASPTIYFSDGYERYAQGTMTLVSEQNKWLSVGDGTYYWDKDNPEVCPYSIYRNGHQPGMMTKGAAWVSSDSDYIEKYIPKVGNWYHLGFSSDKSMAAVVTETTEGGTNYTVRTGAKLRTYSQGERVYETDDAFHNPSSTASGRNWAFGSYAHSAADALPGKMDELRILKGIASDLWIKCEYQFALNAPDAPDEVEPAVEGAVLMDDPTLMRTTENEVVGYRASITGRKGVGKVYLVWGPVGSFSLTSALSLAALPEGVSCVQVPSSGAAAAEVAGQTYSHFITQPAYVVCQYAFVAVGTVTKDGETTEVAEVYPGEQTFCLGDVAIAWTCDAVEGNQTAPGLLTVSRGEGNTTGDLTVSYTVSGTAEAGTHYVALSGTVTIPDGAASAEIVVTPRLVNDGAHTVVVTLREGAYGVAAEQASATVTIQPFIPPVGSRKAFTCTVSGYAGTEELVNYPVLLKLNESIDGFRYADFGCANGADLLFYDESGQIPFEVDTWNPEGTSLVWVRLSRLQLTENRTKGTKILAYYGSSTPTDNTPSDVWANGYVAVYHLNEGALPLKDTTQYANNLTEQIGDKGADVGVTGVIGKGVDLKENIKSSSNRGFKAADADQLDGFSTMTVETWVKPKERAVMGLVSKRSSSSVASWYMLDMNTYICVRIGTGTTTGQTSFNFDDGKDAKVFQTGRWNRLAFTYDASSAKIIYYCQNDAESANSLIAEKTVGNPIQVPATTAPLYLGALQAGDSRNFSGLMDEVRISRVVRSADWLQANYDCVVKDDFVVVSGVKSNLKPRVSQIEKDEGGVKLTLAADTVGDGYKYAALAVDSPSADVTAEQVAALADGDWTAYSANIVLSAAAPAQNVVAKYYRIVMQSTRESTDVTVGDPVYGILRVDSANEKMLVSVPWGDLATGHAAVAIADLVKTENLSGGDYLLSYDHAESRYLGWALGEQGWAPLTCVSTQGGLAVAAGAAEATMARGGAFWLVRPKTETRTALGSFYLSGRYTQLSARVTIVGGSSAAPGYTLLGNPTTAAVAVNALDWGTGPVAGDQLSIPDGTVPRVLKWDAEKGEWYRMVSKLVNGRVKQVRVTDDTIPVGQGFWYIRAAGAAAFTFEWKVKAEVAQ